MDSREEVLNEIKEAKEALEARQAERVEMPKLPEEIKESVVQKEEPEKERSPIEKKAIELGWKSPEEFEGAEEEFISASEFIRRGELFGKISDQSKLIRKLEAEVRDVQTNLKDSERRAYQKAIEDLASSKRSAVQEGDIETYTHLERQEKEIQTQLENIKAKTNPVVDPVKDAVEKFKSRNPWFTPDLSATNDDDVFKSAYALKRWDHYVKTNPEFTVDEALDHIEKDIEVKFKPSNSRRDAPSVVEAGGAKRVGRPKGPTEADLNPVQRQFMKAFVKEGFGTEQDYIDKLHKDGRL